MKKTLIRKRRYKKLFGTLFNDHNGSVVQQTFVAIKVVLIRVCVCMASINKFTR